MNTTGVPSDFYQRLKAKFESARHDGSLVFTPSTKVNDTVDGIDIRYTLAPALAKKPGAIANEKDKDAAPSLREASPWINPDDKLLVLDKFYKDKYIACNQNFSTPGEPSQ
jgi:ATP adenylyltransferase